MKKFIGKILVHVSVCFLSMFAAEYAADAQDVAGIADTSAFAAAEQQETAEPAKGSDFDVQSVIFGHTNDAYEWHITDIGSRHITIPLPIIARSSTGWHMFSSARLEEGPFEGLYISQSGKYSGKLVERNEAGEEVRPLDISVTKNVVAMMFSSALLVLLILHCTRWYRRHDVLAESPKGVAALMEPVIMMVHNDMVKDAIGEDYERYSPYLCTAFFWILINNLLGIIPIFPGGANVTGNIAITMTLALCTFVAINFFGNKHYFKDVFWPDVPWWLKVPVPLMPVIEIFSAIVKPISLMIRLFANILAGHIIAISLVCVIFMFAKYGPLMFGGMSFVTVLLGIFMDLLEVLVAFLQAYVFTILSAIFIGLSRQKA